MNKFYVKDRIAGRKLNFETFEKASEYILGVMDKRNGNISLDIPLNISGASDIVWIGVNNNKFFIQSIIQNTLEQSLVASMTYLAWSVLMPGNLLSVVPLASIAFGIGRLLFIVGYGYGAPARAVGFTLSFYVTVGMLGCLTFFLVNKVI